MENPSFEDSPKVSAPNDTVDNPPGPSKPLSDPSGKDQKNLNIPSLARMTDDEDNESPPAYVQRYMPKKTIQDDLDLEQPPADPVPGPHVDRLDPEAEAIKRKRQQRRIDQLAKEGPSRLIPDSPNLPPLPPPEQYPDPDDHIRQQGVNADNPEQQEAVAGQQVDNAPEQGVADPDPVDLGQQVDNAPVRILTWREMYVSCWEGMHSFYFQYAFYTVVIILALATGVLAAMNWMYCPMNTDLHYVMAFVSVIGTMTIISRLLAMYYDQQFPDSSDTCWWISVRVMEVVTWISFCCQLVLFFKQTPSFNPSETNYCMKRLYRINCAFIYVAFTLMALWTIVNARKLTNWLLLVLTSRTEPQNA